MQLMELTGGRPWNKTSKYWTQKVSDLESKDLADVLLR